MTKLTPEQLEGLTNFYEDALKGIEIVPASNTETYWKTAFPHENLAVSCCLVGAAVIGHDGTRDISRYDNKTADIYERWPILIQYFTFPGCGRRESVFSRIAAINDEQGRGAALAAVARWIEIGAVD